jgi:hypothetical protein
MIHSFARLKENFRFWKIEILAIPTAFKWFRAKFRGPAPHYVKMNFLSLAKGVDVWIETGTYLGQTARRLSMMGGRVISIEPSLELSKNARDRLSTFNNIDIVNALSEDVLEETLSSFETSKENHIAFWLDGHFSEGNTFQGPVETPIESELEIISSHLTKFIGVWVFVDDFRCFVNAETDYPAPSVLVDWAKRNNLNWTVENDIFLATNSPI